MLRFLCEAHVLRRHCSSQFQISIHRLRYSKHHVVNTVKENSSYEALYINRDTMTDIQMLGVRSEKAGTFEWQLALAHTYGSGSHDSCRNTVDAVENLLYGINIDHYMSFTMDAVAKINDSVGGVTVTLLDDFTHIADDMTKGSNITLIGEMALRYVRDRNGLENNTNTARMERQKQYLAVLKEKLMQALKNDEMYMVKLLEDVDEYVVSDLTVNQLSRMSGRLGGYTDCGSLSVAGEALKGEEFMEFYADDDELKRQVTELFFDRVS